MVVGSFAAIWVVRKRHARLRAEHTLHGIPFARDAALRIRASASLMDLEGGETRKLKIIRPQRLSCLRRIPV
ncbi:hypothetical protein KC361_g109 [Hortaea werneckii]|nr:hypothetical protein KC361_g109 [Hortaea werneckii]